MNKKYLMKGVALAAIAMVAASCNHDAWDQRQDTSSQTAKEYEANFKSLVLGGQNIDASQTWSTAKNAKVNVSVNLDYDANYKVYITTSDPLIQQGAYVGVADIKSGSNTSISISKPEDAAILYAACYDKDGHATVKPFFMSGSEATISFGTTSASQAPRRATSTGNRWSITPKSMPDLSAYTTGTLYEMEEAFNTNGSTEVNQADGSEKHLKITGTYTGSIARIQSYANQSVYVTGTWNIPEDQRCTGSSVIVVGEGGVINIPANHMLSTNANNEEGTTGMIYVMPGGKITGDGQLQFSNGTETFSYNAGTITVKDVNINGGTLYNAGQMGGVQSEHNPALVGPAGTVEAPSKFINMGQCTLASTGGAGLSIENACNMYVIGNMSVGNTSKMDNGSYTEVGSFTGGGDGAGNCLLYMGEGAYLKIKGDLSINNFGVWGPNTENPTPAVFEISNEVSYLNWTEYSPATFMLDNVDVVIPEDFDLTPPTNFQYNPRLKYSLAVLTLWMNANGNNGMQSSNGYVVINEWGTKDGSVEDSRRTCSYGTSPSFTFTKDTEDNCGIDIKKKKDKEPENSWIYFAFEDLGDTDDFDFNDVVVRVSTPDENSKSTVELCAIGGTLLSTVFNGSTQLGNEVHTYGEFGTNTQGTLVGVPITELGEVDIPAGTTPADLNINIKVKRADGNIITVGRPATGEIPFCVIVSGDENGKWYWPQERVRISDAYSQFGEWGANMSTNPDWYKHPTTSKVVKW
jgi:hypothetical protein